jgi:diguanylate cyclase (GGDEF)-like protein
LHAFRRPLPSVVLEQILADGRPQPVGQVLSLPAGTTKLEFRYAAISFLMPRFLRYRQRLQGMDHNWVDRGNQRGVQYTNLKAGNYRFQVNVSAPGLGQSWSPQVTAIQIEIQPRLWERPWVLALATIAGLLLLWALVRWRLANLHQRAAQLERIVGQRTSDLQEHADRLRASDQEKTELLERLREQSEAFERMALEDALTGIGNRRSLDSQLDAAFDRAVRGDRALCFALFDIDEFKLINDRYSHAVGDQALVAVAHALRDALGGAGVLARWGGEEFAVLFERVPFARAHAICDAMRLAVAALDCSAYAPGWQLTISAGIAARQAAARPEDLVARADALLYQAKQGGRNRVCS